MSSSVGQIGLDLVVNKNDFNQQMRGVESLAKKAGLALAAAFSIRSIVRFSKECLNLGSDLAEVQNVIDVTFPKMTKQVNDFAQSAVTAFGLSETMAKKFTGTFGAISKSFGFTEKAAYNMSTTLTGLAGDVASFYNISQDEAYTKLKSVFTGETETLKDLGVVMTQAALDAFALANGYGKTTKQMSEQEKVALRYKFVMDKLSASSGDFMRTSDGWANQTRVLKLQFDSLKASIGQGLINVLTPVIKSLNTLLSKINQVAKGFSDLTAKLMGKKQKGGTGISQAVQDAEDLNASMGDAADGAQGAAKKIKNAFLGIDEINTLPSASGDAAGGGDASGDIPDTSGASDTVEEVQKVNPLLDETIKKAKELAGIFKSGFVSGLGNDFEKSTVRVKEHLNGIKESLSEIFTNQKVVSAANNWSETVTYALGQISGSCISIGQTVAENLIGGIDKYLKQNKDRIKEFIVDMFDIGSDIAEKLGDFSEAFSYVLEAFRSENGEQLTANLIGVFTDAFMGVQKICGKLIRDLLNVIIKPFVDNKEEIRKALEGFLGVCADVCGTIKDTIDQTFGKLNKIYDEHIKPFIDSVAEGLSFLTGEFLDFWNKNVQPMLEKMGQKFKTLMSEHIQPMLDKACELLGSVADALKVLWENVLVPVIDWVINNVLPVVLPILEGIYNAVIECAGFIADAVGGLLTMLKGIIDFIVGVFTGDWDKAWNGIKLIVTGWAEQVFGIFNAALSAITNFFKNKLDFIHTLFKSIFSAIGTVVGNLMGSISSKISDTMNGIKSGISNVLNAIKSGWSNAWTDMKNTVINIFNGIWSGIKGVINSIIGGVESMTNSVIKGINGMITGLNSLHIDAPDWVTKKFGIGSFGFNIPSLGEIRIPKLAQGGYVERNTPRLAVVGDNRQYGEIITPENKMLEVMLAALEEFFTRLQSGGSMQQAAADGGDIIIQNYISSERLDELIITAQQRRNMRTGGK